MSPVTTPPLFEATQTRRVRVTDTGWIDEQPPEPVRTPGVVEAWVDSWGRLLTMFWRV